MAEDATGEAAPRPQHSGLAGYFAGMPANANPKYVMIYSKGRVGFLPRGNLRAAMEIDANLKVLDEA